MKKFKPPLVSILIPAFNCRPWIQQTINSALLQTWENKEVVVVDDGSTDGTWEACSALKSPRLKVIRQDNQGGCQARNRAYKECQGEFVQWLDSDDLLAPDKIARQMARVEEEGDALKLWSSAWAKFFYRLKKAREEPTPLWGDLSAVDWLVHHMGGLYWMPPVVWLASRTLTDKAGPWDERLSLDDDGEYACRLVSHSSGVGFLPESLCYYRMANQSSLSHSWSRAAWESLCLATCLKAEHVLRTEDSPKTRDACLKGLNWAATYLEGKAPDLSKRVRQRVSDLGGVSAPSQASLKYAVVRGVLGARRAGYLKSRLWRLQCRALCSWDWLLYSAGRVLMKPAADPDRAAPSSSQSSR
jgi:hypothetical protein